MRPQLAASRFVPGGPLEQLHARSVGTAALNDYESAEVGSALVSSRSRSSKKVKAGDPVQSFFQKVRDREQQASLSLPPEQEEREQPQRAQGRHACMQEHSASCTSLSPHCHAQSRTQVRLAWNIFFPEQAKEVSPKEEVKKRLRMVLVADRCGMNPASLSEMKKHIVKALAVSMHSKRGSEPSGFASLLPQQNGDLGYNPHSQCLSALNPHPDLCQPYRSTLCGTPRRSLWTLRARMGSRWPSPRSLMWGQYTA